MFPLQQGTGPSPWGTALCPITATEQQQWERWPSGSGALQTAQTQVHRPARPGSDDAAAPGLPSYPQVTWSFFGLKNLISPLS